jgi:hypothetical protein
MNTQEEHPFDELETAASMAIGTIFLFGRTLSNCDAHPSGGPGRHEKEGIEVLMLEVGDRLRKATNSIRDMTAEQLRTCAECLQEPPPAR